MGNYGKGIWGLALAVVLGCPAEDDGGPVAEGPGDSGDDGTPMTGDSSSGGGMPAMCLGIGGPNPEGAACTDNDECMSGVCLIYRDVPVNADAACGADATALPTGCLTRITGTVLDFATGEPLSGVTVTIAKALDAIAVPTNPFPLVDGVSGADGRVDLTPELPIKAPIGIVAVVGELGGAEVLTATGVAAPDNDMDNLYTTGTGVHEFYRVPPAVMAEWTTLLEGDPAIPSTSLPLGDAGGVVGLVRDRTNGDPVPGAVITSSDNDSLAIVRYLAEDRMSFTADVTSANGLFVILNPNTPEDVVATIDDVEIGSGTVGAADSAAVFTLLIDAAL